MIDKCKCSTFELQARNYCAVFQYGENSGPGRNRTFNLFVFSEVTFIYGTLVDLAGLEPAVSSVSERCF